jgi:hypothetical protein
MRWKLLGFALLIVALLVVGWLREEIQAQPVAKKPGEAPPEITLYSDYAFPIQFASADDEVQKLVAQLRAKPDPATEAALKKLVEESFDKRHAAQVAEAKVLEERLRKMQEILKKRQENKAEIVARRIKQLRGERDDLDWDMTSLPPPVAKQPNTSPPGLPGISFNATPSPASVPGTRALPPIETLPSLGGGSMTVPGPSAVPSLGLPRSNAASDKDSPRATTDIKTLELELKLAAINVEEVQTSYKRDAKNFQAGTLDAAAWDKSRFAVEKAALAYELAARRLTLAKGSTAIPTPIKDEQKSSTPAPNRSNKPEPKP